jgi:hypothetical protein
MHKYPHVKNDTANSIPESEDVTFEVVLSNAIRRPVLSKASDRNIRLGVEGS